MSKKILIVDDNELMVEVVTYILMNNGYDVVSINNSDELFKSIKKTHPDLVILNAGQPGINGNEICQLIKLNNTTQNLPVIMFSVDDEATDDSLGQWGAPDDILYKPFDINCLIEKVQYQLAA